jgi:hypothetical protein
MANNRCRADSGSLVRDTNLDGHRSQIDTFVCVRIASDQPTEGIKSMQFAVVAEVVKNIAQLLEEYGTQEEAAHYFELENGLRNGEVKALQIMKSEVRGAMGWGIGDRIICPENGDPITQEQTGPVNQRLSELICDLEAQIRLAADKFGVQLR